MLIFLPVNTLYSDALSAISRSKEIVLPELKSGNIISLAVGLCKIRTDALKENATNKEVIVSIKIFKWCKFN